MAIRQVFYAACLATASHPAQGAVWQHITTTAEDGTKWSLDTSSLRKVGNIIQASFRWDRSKAPLGKIIDIRQLLAIDCTARTMTLLSYEALNSDGGVERSETFSDHPKQQVVDDSVGTDMLKSVCHRTSKVR